MLSFSENDLPPRQNFWQKWILETEEAPTNQRSLKFLDGKINLTCTYHRDSDLPCIYGYYFPLNKYYIGPFKFPKKTNERNKHLDELEMIYKNQRIGLNVLLQQKEKEVLWFLSNCNVVDRNKFAKLLNRSRIQVDIFGKCGRQEPCKTKFKTKCVHDHAKKYWFYFAAENSHCEDYITEKPWNSLIWGAVPIVFGDKIEKYEKTLPPNSFLHVDNFTSTHEIVKYLKYLIENPTQYLKYHQWRMSYDFLRSHDFDFLQLCTMCKQGENNHIRKHIFSQEWNEQTLCTKCKETSILFYFILQCTIHILTNVYNDENMSFLVF